jgi:aconitate hydratase 2/2-methylisocitrate dehydratase
VTVLKNGAVIAESQLKTPVILDEVRAGGRIPLIVGRGLTARAREALGLPVSTLFCLPQNPADPGKGYSLAQKMVGRACGLPEGKGVLPGTYCEPRMTTVGSQDTTGPMTRDELKDLACLGFSADMVMQSFCHTAAYPKLVDVRMHRELPSSSAPVAASRCVRATASSTPGSTACCCPTPSAPAATRTRVSRSASRSRPVRAWSLLPPPLA